MPFDPRTKSRHTTTLPAALRDELGLPAPNAKRNFRRDARGKPQLKAIGRPQSAINGAAKGTHRGPIKSLRNQEKEQQERQQQSRHQHKANANKNAVASSSSTRQKHAQEPESKPPQKRKHEKQPKKELKVIKKAKELSLPAQDEEEGAEPTQQKTRLNPFTGEMETVKSTSRKSSSALEKMLAKVEAGPSQGKSKAADALGGGKKKSRHRMSQQEKEEEDEIRWLEYNLGKSRQGEDVVRDELDDFLDDLDRFQVGMYDESESEEEDEEGGEESDSGLEEVTASEEESSEEEESGESEEERGEGKGVSEDEEEDDLDGLDEEGMYDFDSNDEDDYSNWDAAMATTDEEDQEDDENESSSDSEDEEEDSEAEEARALISGAATNATPNASTSSSSQQTGPTTATKYIPPALRAKLAAESSASTSTPASASSGPGLTEVEMDPVSAQKLRRQAQGLLNRLGDANIDTILTEYESLYRTHPRAHVTSTITQLILDTITSRTNLIDTFVILHAALVAALHKIVGVEFAAFFVQRLVEELTKHYNALKQDEGKAREDEEGKGKECSNLTVLACELYNLHVVACPLIYNLIRMFLGQQPDGEQAQGTVGETDIELLLKIIRSCGHQLRTDDPTSLKSIISLTQSRVSSSSSTRTRFMLERMAELQKNAKGSKGGANDASNPNSPAGQLLMRMKKFLGGMAKKRTIKAYEPLRIGLKDLKDAHKKGKWWLVGAAWTGQTDQTDAQGLTKLLPMNARADAIQSSTPNRGQVDSQQEKLLSLARAQGMNTDARRTVFITLLTAEDYKQAAENVLMLKLNDVQRREVIRVLVHCVGSEAVYNPYYTLIGTEICRNDHGMRITLQYCLWDFLREIGEKEVGGEKFAAALFDGETDAEKGKSVDPRRVANLARAYAWWFTHDCLSLQALKTVDFTMIQPRPTEFVGLLMIHIILSLQSRSAAKTLHLPTVTAQLKEDKIAKFLQSNLVGGSADLSKGLLFFLNTKLDKRAQRHLVLGQEKDKALRKKMQPLLDTVSDGLKCMVKAVQAIVQQLEGVAVESDGFDVDMDESDDVQDDF